MNLLLLEFFGGDAGAVRPLTGGFFSRAFAFTAGGREYVIRLTTDVHAGEGFAKDEYAWRHFASPTLPIPKIVAIGSIDNACYAIGERATGRTLREFSPTERQAVRSAVLETLAAVGQSDVHASHGYGDWGSDGNGHYTSWRGYLAAIMDNHTEGYYQNWHQLFHDSFLEREVYEAVFRTMLELSVWCPEERALIHNDFQFENILSDGEHITGVIDWANALYGDPLYDVAWLAWQSAHPGWWYDHGTELLQARFGTAPHYAVRIACYQCHIGLDHLRFYAKNDNRAGYDSCRDWLLALVASARESY